jgi:peptidoglycan hydrolase-like protein with peptidoglycan-binding domain
MAVAVLATAGLGSLLLAGGTSSATAPARTTYGPVARPVVVPLVDVHGPVLPQVPAALAPVGPRVVAPAAPVGPPGLVGPDSPPRDVRVVQRLLNRAGAQLRVDGAWGPATTRAVERVQERAGLPVDGRVGPSTAAVLAR